MTHTEIFGEVWICDQCAGGADEPAKTPTDVEQVTPRPQALEEVTQGESGAAAPGSQHGPHDGRAELSDEYYDDCKDEDPEHYPESSPQTGFV
jgi:hypothetical protein